MAGNEGDAGMTEVQQRIELRRIFKRVAEELIRRQMWPLVVVGIDNPPGPEPRACLLTTTDAPAEVMVRTVRMVANNFEAEACAKDSVPGEAPAGAAPGGARA